MSAGTAMNFSVYYFTLRQVLDLTRAVLATTAIGQADQVGDLTYL